MLRPTLLLLLCIPLILTAQKTDTKLQSQIKFLLQGFHGNVGVFVHDLKHNKIVALNADSVFPTASIVKMPILLGIMDKITTGQLNYHQRLTYTDSLFYDEGDDILSSFKDSATIELSKVMMLMLTISDNCASLWLQGLSGGGKRINELLDSLGFKNTRVNSRTPGREADRSQYGWGQTTPREIAGFMERVVNNQLLDKASDEKMLRLLGRQYWDEEALSQIPPGVFVADKNGAVDESRNEVVYVNSNNNPYIFSIFSKNNADTSWEYNNEAWVLTRKLSSLLWQYYNPKSKWQATSVSEVK
ncbi:serine hydrolase [Panacibacter ginsenosidivorans]|uniref:beta-lactamase n=1 Tax=Panacibacter ginsenosidivorans TaxID=1813871 RepID=A0A5B8V9E4_9BACT|nr:serine hydrolase [Panacibacter ginsenosidivorans]QEC68140.1 serine hydrolase [Panacibacter ginsenosidivorans]